MSRRRSLVPFALVALLTVSACTPQTPVPPPPQDPVLIGALRGRNVAKLLVEDAAARVDVEMAELPGLLYRITTPPDGGLAPRVANTRGVVRVGLRPTGGTGLDTVRILLNRGVRWDIRLSAGAGEQRLDLAAGRIARVELGASGLVEMRLPPPVGTWPVVLRDGAGTVVVAGPPRVPMRIVFRGGAGAVVTPWTVNNGTAAGATLAAPGWATASDRYAMQLRAGVGSITIS
jgi:hypothetical protein